MSNIPLRQWIENFNNGVYDSPDKGVQIDAGWYDWFCRDSSLRGKTYALASKVKRLAKSPKVNIDTMYVWFKNNCPCDGTLYDEFRFADIYSDKVIYTIVPRHGQKNKKGQAEVWGRENDSDGPLVVGNWKAVLAFFGV
jgi:hypothetical protein